MKTAISIPDEVYARVEERVRVLGTTRSQFYALAAQHYLMALEADSLTEQIDAALGLVDDDSNAVAAQAGHHLLDGDTGNDW